uniref:ATP-binding cassette domain-containing protein n=1 Tax=Candidatus Phytoplasma australasiaticum subsp. australasiaticum TaxID=2832407 RepID=A0A7S7JMJ5_9MOLU|nr:ATP-binding cassette domain-containing protein ['Parthenium hysterophorus' phyllody phytoplasma]
MILNNINLQIKPKEIVSIIGRSGSGKSTLLRCLNLLTKPDSGKIFLIIIIF